MTASNNSPRVAAVVLNWCAEDDTAACVTSLLAATYRALDVLIVDNGSPDGSGERLRQRFPSLHFLQTGENLGYAGGNLRAIEWALARDYDYVLVCNDDAEVQPACLSHLVDALESDEGAAAAAPTIVHHHSANIIWWAGGEWIRYKGQGRHVGFGANVSTVASAPTKAVSFLNGCVLLLRANAIRAAGGFRADFFAYVEDLELSVRFARAGWRLLYVPHARASHKVPFPPPPESPFAIRLRDRNRRRLVQLHYSFSERLLFTFWFYPTRLIHLARYCVRGDMKRARAIVDGLVGTS